MYIPYLMQKHLRCRKVQPSKVESYLEVNTWADWRQQDLISECSQGLAYWTQTLPGHIVASYCLQSLVGLANLLSAISCYTNFIFQKINRRTWNSQLFVIWPPFIYITDKKGSQMTNNCEFHSLLLIWNMKFVTGYGCHTAIFCRNKTRPRYYV